MSKQTFSHEIIETIRSIPEGMVSSYGRIAALAGNPRAARQVVRVLHACSEKEDLPWWRVVNRDGEISLQSGYGREEQEDLLLSEGIKLTNGRVDLERWLWEPAES